jgi:hypothetical protein
VVEVGLGARLLLAVSLSGLVFNRLSLLVSVRGNYDITPHLRTLRLSTGRVIVLATHEVIHQNHKIATSKSIFHTLIRTCIMCKVMLSLFSFIVYFLIADRFNTHRVTVETHFKCKSQHYFRRRVNVLRDHIKSELLSTARTELML